MYLLSYEKSDQFAVDLLGRVLRDRTSRYASPSERLQDEQLNRIDPSYGMGAEFSKLTKDVLKELLGEKPEVSYLISTYGKGISESARRDVARAMVYARSIGGKDSSYLDAIAVALLEEVFKGSSRLHPRFSTPGNEQSTFSFDQLRTDYLKHFIDPTENEALVLQFRFHSEGVPVRLQLSAETSGKVSWSLRGVSTLRSSSQRLLLQLREVVEDFEARKRWMDEYSSSKPRPGIERIYRDEIQRIFGVFFENKLADVDGLSPGIVFADEPIVLEEQARAFIGRCELCGAAVALEPVSWIGSSYDTPNWADDSKLYRNHFAERQSNEILRRFHYSCTGTTYKSSRTGKSERIGGRG